MIRVFSREWSLVYGSVLGSLGTHVSSFRSINNYHLHLASNRSIWQNLHSYFKLGLHKLCCHRVTVARTANLWKRARPQSLHRPNIRCHLAGDIFYKHLHLQTVESETVFKTFQKPEETVGRCWKKGADQMIDLWEVTKRWTSFVQLSETKSNVEDRHGSERAYEPIWVGSQP